MQSVELWGYRPSKANPFVPPDWRYRLARKCLTQQIKPSYRYDDKLTWDLFRFLRNREKAFGPDQRVQLRKAQPAIWSAFELHHGRRRNLRPVIEAYMLAGMVRADDASIARRLGAPAEGINWFRSAFYDVERLRKYPLYVVHHLIGVADEEGQGMLDTHRIWKLIGYRAGSDALDRLFRGVQEDEDAGKSGDLAAWLSCQTQAALQMKQCIAINKLNADNPKYLQTLLKSLLAEQRGPEQVGAASLNALDKHISAMLGELVWCHGEAARAAYKGTVLEKYDECAAELRDDELQLVAAGDGGPKLEEVECLNIGPSRPTTNPDQGAKE